MFRIQAVLCMLCVAVVVQAKENADDLVFTTEESPPFNMMVNGKIAGIAVEKVTEIMNRAKLPYTLDILPWARAYQMALEKSNVCVFSTTRTQEREAKFKWVGPLALNTWTLYGLVDGNIRLSSLEDARPFRIGTYNADARDTFLRAKGFNVDPATSDAVNPRKLLARRIDLWATGPYEANAQIIANGWSSQIVPILTFSRVELYLACNLAVRNEVVDKLNVILNVMNNDGSAAAIDRRYERWPN
ncbi:substrate-binding periplasmic protein [Chitinimonas sp. PSY-7]|uniref:transporter substrate-binding domain-containing protein n=1 Tax=Chitinimonas sp. PSY-7 TaxID=3459088 RepID=UPI00404030BC